MGTRFGVLADAPALTEALSELGFVARAAEDAELLVVDVDRVSAAALEGLRRRAYIVALMGWWDAREAEYREAADFVLNAPVRGWQIEEMVEAFRTRTASRVRVA